MRRWPRLLKLLLVLLAAALVLFYFYHCPFRFLLGVSCPGCGMTRALFSAVFADLETAFAFHPLLPLMIPAGLYILLQLFCGMRVPSKRQNTYIILLASVMILVYVMRLLADDPVLRPDFEASVLARVLHVLQEI